MKKHIINIPTNNEKIYKQILSFMNFLMGATPQERDVIAELIVLNLEYEALPIEKRAKFILSTDMRKEVREKLDIGQPIYITKIYDKLNNLEEIVDVTSVEITNESGGLYSDETLNMKKYTSADGRILYAPEDVIYEIKYPNLDIKGTIR